MWQNTADGYGWVAVVLHWLVAVFVVGLFALGLWMVELTYYDAWYRRSTDIHKGVGILLCLVMLARLGWRLVNPRPVPDPTPARLERVAAAVTHVLLYVLLFAVMTAGYLISTADGRAIDVFGLFSVPATIAGVAGQADIAGDVHRALAIALIVLAGIHSLAALKHHFIDRDRTLLRMLGRAPPVSRSSTQSRKRT